MNLNNFVEPRYDIWMKTANMLEESYLSLDSNVDWDALQKNIPSASKERIQGIFKKINNSKTINKGERILLIMLKLLNDNPVKNGAEILKQLQNHICDIETIFVPWEIILENQKRNHHEAETEPMKLAIVIVTRGVRGIGFGIFQQLAAAGSELLPLIAMKKQ